jgi:hypothetical protein
MGTDYSYRVLRTFVNAVVTFMCLFTLDVNIGPCFTMTVIKIMKIAKCLVLEINEYLV